MQGSKSGRTTLQVVAPPSQAPLLPLLHVTSQRDKISFYLKVRTSSLTSTKKFVERSHALPCPETDRGGTRHPARALASRAQHRARRHGCGLGGARHGLHL